MGFRNIRLLNEVIDVSQPFAEENNIFFHMTRVKELDVHSGAGVMEWQRYSKKIRTSFSQVSMPFERSGGWEFPDEYGQDKLLPFDISFIGTNVIRLRMSAKGPLPDRREKSLMLEKFQESRWECRRQEGGVCYTDSAGSCVIEFEPSRIRILDRSGRLLTKTKLIQDKAGIVNSEPVPTSFVRCTDDLKRYLSLSLSIKPDEAFLGGGESFTEINKRGQKLNLWMCDPKGTMNREMYKPVPFLISSSGYGLFVHTSAPVTFDLGYSYNAAANIYAGDEILDCFFILGDPRQILESYTRLTGRAPVLPLWTFGLWMGRITYQSQKEVMAVAKNLRSHRIPCDVIHIDTGWFDVEWRCNYEFAPDRFEDPEEMLRELKDMDLHASLWQMPYFNPNNTLYPEIMEKGLAVLDGEGRLPGEDAVLDFSSEDTGEWYSRKIEKLTRMGVSTIKADFGEGAPLAGQYKSGKSGLTEHNLYPLRYAKAVCEGQKRAGAEQAVIWARSAWAGSQKYPVHWGGDSETSDSGMASSLRGGLSLGACGFTYWSHDVGGFVKKSPAELYLRWLAFGIFTSHIRCHGQPPKEPWEYGEEFTESFRKIVSTRYHLLPYIYTQSVYAAERGLPVVRALAIDYPRDPICWKIGDQYMFGENMLVAPLLEANICSRYVYLPEGEWIDYQTCRSYKGNAGYQIEAAGIPIIVLVKNGSLIPHTERDIQSTSELDWEEVVFYGYSAGGKTASGMLGRPGQGLEYIEAGGQDEVQGKVKFMYRRDGRRD